MAAENPQSANPLSNLDQWDDFIERRYKEGKSESEFRQYDAQANPRVAEFYRNNHEKQTVEYVLSKENLYFGLTRGKKSIWEAAEYLNTLIDDSDPDTDLTQIEHLLQTSEAIRKDGHPPWMVLVGFIHDLGKCLCLYGVPQWGVRSFRPLWFGYVLVHILPIDRVPPSMSDSPCTFELSLTH